MEENENDTLRTSLSSSFFPFPFSFYLHEKKKAVGTVGEILPPLKLSVISPFPRARYRPEGLRGRIAPPSRLN